VTAVTLWMGLTGEPRQQASLTSLAIIPSVTQGRAKMQKTVIPSPVRGMDSTDGHSDEVVVALR